LLEVINKKEPVMYMKVAVTTIRAGSFIWLCCAAVCYHRNTTHELAFGTHSVVKQTLSNNSASAAERKEAIWTCFACLTEELTCMDRN
jgi:heterodisulfide reductase subunit C